MSEAPAPAGIDPAPVTAWMTANVDGVEPPLRFERVAGGHSCLTYIVEDQAGRSVRAAPATHRPRAGHRPRRGPGAQDHLRPGRLGRARRAGPRPVHRRHRERGALLHHGVRRRRSSSTTPTPLASCPWRPAATPASTWSTSSSRCTPSTSTPSAWATSPSATDYLGRQLRRWAAQWEGSKTKEIPGMERLQQWLIANQPADADARIVHGDFRLGNCIHAPDGTILAMLDWELCTLGDPLADVSYLLRSWAEPSDPPAGQHRPAQPGRRASRPGRSWPTATPPGRAATSRTSRTGWRSTRGARRASCRACTTGTSPGRWRPAATRTSTASSTPWRRA